MAEPGGRIRRAAVLGAGVMGSQLAALLAAADIEVDLYDLPGKAQFAIEGLKKQPAALELLDDLSRIHPRSLDSDLERLSRADWVLEAVVENLAIKEGLFERIEPHVAGGAVISTNTSGMSIAELARQRSPSFRRRFLGTHFFNPPRPMYLLEIIPHRETDPAVTKAMVLLGEERLGKGIVRCNDTPLFVANRIGIFVRLLTIWTMLEEGLSIEEVDAVCGVPLGRPKTAVFRLGDLVGLDTTANVARYLATAAPHDERRALFRLPPFIEQLLERGSLGDKTRAGYYQKVAGAGGKEIRVLDPRTMEYIPTRPVESKVLDQARAIANPRERIAFLVAQDDRYGRFAWKTLSQSLVYAANRLREIADSPAEIDAALRWGFNWELGLFEIWDALGLAKTIDRMQADSLAVPEPILRMCRSGRTGFYDDSADPATVFLPTQDRAQPIHDPALATDPSRRRERHGRLAGNDDASLVDIGDGVGCLEFHSKMNTLGPAVVDMLEAGLDQVASGQLVGLVIGHNGAHFFAGANLRRLLDLGRQGKARSLDRRLQSACVRMGRSGLPIVAAPAGLTLGGGAEIVLRAPAVRAAADLRMGLVEAKVGLIPGAGGTTEMLARFLASPVAAVDPYAAVERAFQLLFGARPSESAREARRLGYLRAEDVIIPNRRFLLARAKQAVLDLAAAGPAEPLGELQILALGRDALAKLRLKLHLAHEAGEITDYDQVVGGELAYILVGGDLVAPTSAPETYFLDLERQAFERLLDDPRTQARIEHLLETGRPLRN